MKTFAWVLLAIVVVYGYAMLHMVAMVDVPALTHPDPERDARLKITVVDAVRHALLFAACAFLSRRFWLYVAQGES